MKIIPEYAEVTFTVSFSKKEQDFIKGMQEYLIKENKAMSVGLVKNQVDELLALLFGLRKGIDGLTYDTKTTPH